MSISISHVRNVFSFWIMFVALCQQTVLSHENLAHYTIIHTSDVHGWVNGHTHSKSFLNADFGDFLSLVENLQNKSHHNILLFDTGDIIDGTGLSDATPIHGQNIIQGFTGPYPHFCAMKFSDIIWKQCLQSSIDTRR
jgi:2',3'-cyclic-nucleotide 2'-phosphodiesterase (5'-nucleotidase family)